MELDKPAKYAWKDSYGPIQPTNWEENRPNMREDNVWDDFPSNLNHAACTRKWIYIWKFGTNQRTNIFQKLVGEENTWERFLTIWKRETLTIAVPKFYILYMHIYGFSLTNNFRDPSPKIQPLIVERKKMNSSEHSGHSGDRIGGFTYRVLFSVGASFLLIILITFACTRVRLS